MTSRMVAVAAIRDPAARARAAHDTLQLLGDEQSAARRIRRDAVRQLRDQGWTWTKVADLLGIHRNRAAHLLDRETRARGSSDQG